MLGTAPRALGTALDKLVELVRPDGSGRAARRQLRNNRQ